MRNVLMGMAVLMTLAGCGRHDAGRQTASGSQSRPSGTDQDDDSIDCASNGADLARDCSVARTETERGLVLTVSHPDGHFRRLLVTTDGRGVIAADGAQRAKVTIVDPSRIEVALAGDHYRLPATLKR